MLLENIAVIKNSWDTWKIGRRRSKGQSYIDRWLESQREQITYDAVLQVFRNAIVVTEHMRQFFTGQETVVEIISEDKKGKKYITTISYSELVKHIKLTRTSRRAGLKLSTRIGGFFGGGAAGEDFENRFAAARLAFPRNAGRAAEMARTGHGRDTILQDTVRAIQGGDYSVQIDEGYTNVQLKYIGYGSGASVQTLNSLENDLIDIQKILSDILNALRQGGRGDKNGIRQQIKQTFIRTAATGLELAADESAKAAVDNILDKIFGKT